MCRALRSLPDKTISAIDMILKLPGPDSETFKAVFGLAGEFEDAFIKFPRDNASLRSCYPEQVFS